MRYKLGFLVGLLLLTGCVSDGIDSRYATVSQKIGPPEKGKSRIVVLQEKRDGLSMAICACEVKLDGVPVGKIPYGKYAYADHPAGRHELVISEVMFPGDTKREIVMESGRTHFFLIRASARHNAMTAMGVMGGLTGIAIAAVATSGESNPGPADLYPLDEPTARTALAELQLAN